MSDKEPIVIGCQATDNFALYLGVLLYSAYANLPSSRTLVAYVIDVGLSDASRQRVEQVMATSRVRLRWISPTDQMKATVDTLEAPAFWGTSTYYRLFLPHLVDSSFDRFIYLDADMVVDDDLSPLMAANLNEQILGAVQDPVCPRLGMTESPLLEDRSYPGDDPYFNGGLLVIDRNAWVEHQITDRTIGALRRVGAPEHADQSVLNAVLHGRWHRLPQRWNALHRCHETMQSAFDTAISDPGIIHYGGAKPDQVDCFHPLRRRFFRYLHQSGFYTPRELVGFYSRLFKQKTIKQLVKYNILSHD